MDAFASTIDQKQVLEVELGINLIVSAGFIVDCISTEGIRTIKLVNFKGSISSMDDKYVFLKEETTGFIYRILQDDLYIACIMAGNEELKQIVANSIQERIANNTTLSPSEIGNRANDIVNHAYIKPTTLTKAEDLSNDLSPIKLLTKYAPSLYFELYIIDYDSRAKVREIFESLFQEMVANLLGMDGSSGLLESYEDIITTLNDELGKDYDKDTLQALGLIKILMISIAEHVNPHNQNSDFTVGSNIYTILDTNINGTIVKKITDITTQDSRIEKNIKQKAILQGQVIERKNNKVILSNIDSLLIFNEVELRCSKDKVLREEILKIFGRHLENLTEGMFCDIVETYIDDMIMIASNDVFDIFTYFEMLIKNNNIQEGIDIIKQLAII